MSFLPGNQETVLNGTTPVTIVDAPGSGVIRMIKEIIVINDDTKDHTMRGQFTGTEVGTVDFKSEKIKQDESGNLMIDAAVLVLDTTGQSIQLYTKDAVATTNPVVTVIYADFTPVDVTPFILRFDTNTDFDKGIFNQTERVGVGNAAVIQLAKMPDNDDDIDFETPGDYTPSNGSDIEVASGVAKLKAQSGFDNNWPLTTPANYTFDNTKIEVTGTGALKDLRPAGATFYSNYASKDGNWGDGVLTGTLNNGATVTGGELVVSGASGRSVDYAYLDNGDVLQIGAARWGYVPQYTGTPGDFQVMFTIGNIGDFDDSIYVYHASSTGKLFLVMYDSAKTLIMVQDLGVWAPTSGTEYEFEFNWDITAGASRLFIDGIQMGSTATQTGTHTAFTDIRVGNNYANTLASNFKINYFLIFDAIQHTANYTAAGQSGITATIYDTADPDIINVTGYVFASAISNFVVTKTIPSGGGLQYQVSSDDGTTFKWWNGAAWVAITAAQTDTFYYDNESNTEADINTNIATLAASGTLKWRSFIRSDGDLTPTLDNININSSVTYPTTDNLYVDTTDNSEISVANITAFLTALITNTLPTNTDVRFLASVNGRVDWQADTGGGWGIVAGDGLRANAMTIAQLQDNIAGLGIGDKTFNLRTFVFTSDALVTATVANVNLTSDAGRYASGSWSSSEYDSGNLGQDYGAVNFTIDTPGSTTLEVKNRAGDVAGALGSYGAALADGDDAGVTGQFYQQIVEMTSPGVDNPNLDRSQCAYVTPIITEVAP